MKAKQNIARLILGVSMLTFAVNVSKAAEPFENLPDDTVLAEVLGQKLYLKDIEPPSDVKKKQQQSTTSKQFALWLKQTRSTNMSCYFKPLWNEYVEERKLTVTEQEIKELKERMSSFMTSQKKTWEIKRDNLAKELTAENLKDDKKAELEKNLNLYNRLLERDSEPNSIYQKTNDDAPKSIILSWKINRELYRQYKGRVIFQQAGPEPLDAFRLFFEEQQSKGRFKFYNKDAEDLFWDYWRNIKHTVYKDPNEAEQIMNTPWWLKEKKDDDFSEAEWGKEVNGFQIRLERDSTKRVFYPNQTPIFRIDLLNTSDKTFSCAPLEQFCELEVDGKWYKWNGTQAVDILSTGLGPKRVHYDFFKIKLAENWLLGESSPQDDKGQPLSLSLGTHVLRVKYKTIAMPESPATEAVSNPLGFQIIPPKPEKKEG